MQQVLGEAIKVDWSDIRVICIAPNYKKYDLHAVQQSDNKDPVMVEAGKKAAHVRATASYTFDEHLEGKPERIQSLMHIIREYTIDLDPAIEEVPKKNYVAYKTSQNIVCVEAQMKNIKLFVKLKASDVQSPPSTYRDVTNLGHFGTGDSEFSVSTETEFDEVKPFIELAYNKVGG